MCNDNLTFLKFAIPSLLYSIYVVPVQGVRLPGFPYNFIPVSCGNIGFLKNPRSSIRLEIRAQKPPEDINSRLFFMTKKGLKTTKILAFLIAAYKETASSSPCALFRNTQYYYALFVTQLLQDPPFSSSTDLHC
jgi:hypothetical protein